MTLTLDIILEAQRRLAAIPAVPEIRESLDAVQMVQARVYPKRRAKNAAHLRRMNNKWKRRYGVRAEPGAFLMDLSLSGLGRGKVLFVHPTLAAIARRALQAVEATAEARAEFSAFGSTAMLVSPARIEHVPLATFRWP